MATLNSFLLVDQNVEQYMVSDVSSQSFVTEIAKSIAKSMVTMPLVGTRLQNWLQTMALQQAVQRAYVNFSTQHPHWVSTLFDEHFVTNSAWSVIKLYLQPGDSPKPMELAIVWDRQIGPASMAVRVRRITELTPIAANFLAYLEAEFDAVITGPFLWKTC